MREKIFRDWLAEGLIREKKMPIEVAYYKTDEFFKTCTPEEQVKINSSVSKHLMSLQEESDIYDRLCEFVKNKIKMNSKGTIILDIDGVIKFIF